MPEEPVPIDRKTASKLNPLIGCSPSDTLDQVATVVSDIGSLLARCDSDTGRLGVSAPCRP